MIIVIDAMFIRVDEHGKVKYASCKRTGKFIKHRKAQVAVDCNRNQCLVALLCCVLINIIGLGYIALDFT